MSNAQQGPVIAIGGEVGDELLGYVARSSNLRSPRIVAFTCASQDPKEPLKKEERYRDRFARLGFFNFAAIHARNKAEADNPQSIAEASQGDVFVFLGGCQTTFMNAVSGTALIQAVLKRHSEGATLAGSSAGAAVLGQIMPTGGKGSEALIVVNIPIAEGLACIPDTAIDMHLDRDMEKGEGRLPRVFALYAYHRNTTIGLYENTAGMVKAHVLEVVGPGHVVIVDKCAVSLTNGHSLKKGDRIDPAWFSPEYLSHGDRYDLIKRARVLDPN
jgi:cyanophycinase